MQLARNAFFFKFSRVGPFGLVFAVQAAISSHLRPLAATCGHSLGHSLGAATCGHLRPLAATCGHLRPLAATCGHLRPLAATCGHLRPLAATCGHLRPLAATCPSGHLRPLAATCGHSSGCKWLQVFEFQIPLVLQPQCKSKSNRLGLDTSPTAKLKSSKLHLPRENIIILGIPLDMGYIYAKEPKTSETGQAWAPVSSMSFRAKFMSRTELLIFKAPARAWKKHETSKIRVSNCNK